MTRPLGISGILLAILILSGGPPIVAIFTPALQAAEPDRQARQPGDQANPPWEKATLGGGCFWCTEAIYRELAGVRKVVSGYSGGQKENPTYEEISTGLTGHAEVVQITFDPTILSYTQLLEVFWKIHDPTTLNQQGPDVGTQYRSVVFYANPKQQRQAEAILKGLSISGAFTRPIVTEISPLINFYPAEDYHQDYYRLHGRLPYCKKVIRPKLKKFRHLFADRLKEKSSRDALPRGKKTKVKEKHSDREKSTDWRHADWRKQLTKMQYHVTCEQGTERAFTGKYWNNQRPGIYRCVRCGQPLFDAAAKYKSGTGWPSCFQPIDKSLVQEVEDRGMSSVRTEVRCSRCGAHLGHVFHDGPQPTGLRYCMNSAALDFQEAETGQSEDNP